MDDVDVVRVLDALEAAGIRYGVTGGWGIDALLGRQTRDHDDVDVGVPAESIDLALATLAPLGYAMTVDERPARLVLEGPFGKVDLHPIVFDATGHGVQTGFDGQTFDYPPGSLVAVGSIAGRPVRCGTPELQVAFHLGYQPTERDRADMAVLAAALSMSLPPPYGDSE
jgi:lincosamide nucleotidyltransferase A/C/D/E